MAVNCIGINNYHLFITFLSCTMFVRYIHLIILVCALQFINKFKE